MVIKEFAKKIVLKEKYNSDSYIKYLKKIGVRIGEDCTIYTPQKTLIDTSRPFLLEFGDHVRITNGVTILTHGYDWSVLKGKYGDVLGSSGKVKIGNNVFIGMNTTILKGVTIGNNVIIGAGSLVISDIPDDCVAVGSPCKRVMSLEEYHEKRIQKQYEEATELVREYRAVYKCEPSDDVLREFFWLFSNNPDNIPKCWVDVIKLVQNYEQSLDVYCKHIPQFNSKDEFLKEI